MRWVFLLVAPCVLAHDPITTKLTWNREISRIFYRKCLACHHEGGKAMSLATYDEARPWAKAIRDEVLARRMPPWGAVKGFGEFQNDASLSEPEINWIVAWVEGGAPKGQEIYLTPPPTTYPAFIRPPTRKIRVPAILPKAVTAVGIETEATGLELIAELPDGSLLPLLRLHHRTPQCPTSYFFRDPITFPKGTKLKSTTQASLLLPAAPTR